MAAALFDRRLVAATKLMLLFFVGAAAQRFLDVYDQSFWSLTSALLWGTFKFVLLGNIATTMAIGVLLLYAWSSDRWRNRGRGEQVYHKMKW